MTQFRDNVLNKEALNHGRGQATLELALLIPTLVFLLCIIILAFRINHTASEASVLHHEQALAKFEHGNGTIEIDGVDIPPNDLLVLVPGVPFNPGDLITDIFTQVGTDIGLNIIGDNLKIFNADKFLGAAAKSAVMTGASSFIQSGFKSVDWEKVAWAAASGGFQSKQATTWFQGSDVKAKSFREATGSAVQGGVLGFTRSEGNLESAAQGATSGLFGSDTYAALENGNAGMLWGAGKGALQSVVTGALDGKVDGKAVLIAAGEGAMGTGQAAKVFTMGTYSGDPRKSALYSGVNAAASSFMQGGNVKDAALSASTAAFYSEQTTRAMAKSSDSTVTLMNGAFGAGTQLIQGQSGESVGKAALQSMLAAETANLPGRTGDITSSLVQNAGSVADIKNSLESAKEQEEAANKLTGSDAESAHAQADQTQANAILQAMTLSLTAISYRDAVQVEKDKMNAELEKAPEDKNP